MAKKEQTYIYRFVLEVRFANKILEFIDRKGEILGSLTKKTSFEKFKIENNGTKIQLNSNDSREIIFFSWENFGLQIEGLEDFEKVSEKIDTLSSLLEPFSDLFRSNISRVGVKNTFLYHKKNNSFETIKLLLKQKFNSSYEKFERKMNATIEDFSYQFVLKQKETSTHLLLGPVTKEEAISKFYDNQKKLYDSFSKEHGILIDIDSFIDSSIDEDIATKSWQELAKNNYDSAVKHLQKFAEYIFEDG